MQSSISYIFSLLKISKKIVPVSKENIKISLTTLYNEIDN